MEKKRDFGLDLVRCVAILGVLLIHACAGGLDRPVGSLDWLASLFWGSVSRASVPLFLMVSGALLLRPEKELSLRRLWGHNIARIAAALAFWATAYGLFDAVRNGQKIGGILRDLLLFRHEFHLYYLHILLLVYALIPLLRALCRAASRRELCYALALWAAAGILYPTLRQFWPFSRLSGIPAQWALNMTWSAAGYALLGYAAKKYPPRRMAAAFSAAAGFAICFGGTWALSAARGANATFLLEGMSPGPALLGFGIFGLCNAARCERPLLRRTVGLLSRASFCVYLSHVFFLRLLPKLGISAATCPCVLSVPLYAALMLCGALAVYAVLSRIPILNKWII